MIPVLEVSALALLRYASAVRIELGELVRLWRCFCSAEVIDEHERLVVGSDVAQADHTAPQKGVGLYMSALTSFTPFRPVSSWRNVRACLKSISAPRAAVMGAVLDVSVDDVAVVPRPW